MPSEQLKEYIISAPDFNSLRVGAKSNNLNKIRGKVDSWIGLPEGIAYQFNSIEDILSLPSNSVTKASLDVLIKLFIT